MDEINAALQADEVFDGLRGCRLARPLGIRDADLRRPDGHRMGVLGVVDGRQLVESPLQRLSFQPAVVLEQFMVDQGAKREDAPPPGPAGLGRELLLGRLDQFVGLAALGLMRPRRWFCSRISMAAATSPATSGEYSKAMYSLIVSTAGRSGFQ